MGYSIRPGTEITDFWPDDDDTTLYLASGYWLTLDGLIQHTKAHFGKAVQMEDIEVTAEKIHTRCIYYDLHDAGDYTNFIVINKHCE